MKPYFKLRDHWKNAGFEYDWVKRNGIVFSAIQENDVAIAGSMAAGIYRKTPYKVPGDIDVVVESNAKAMDFISSLTEFLSERSVHFTIRCNANNGWTAPGAKVHYRFKCPFWKEICIMVVDNIRFYYWNGYKIQLYSQVKERMEEIEEKSPKGRIVDRDEDPDSDNDLWDRIDSFSQQKDKNKY